MLIARKPPGRTLHIAYALGFLPITVLAVWMQMRKQAAMDLYAEQYDNPIAQQHEQAGAIGLVIGMVMMLVFLSWPTFCLIWFTLVKTKAPQITGAPADADPHNPFARA